ncbi:MAG TPA: multiheme c-type cytochrome [Candidatus Brocadiia bacterium]|nr:hydroxylamine oxidoreductase [Planctomycetota bacterium]MBI4007993.1 hydroxylamine oxidoreductase [Planctomycetota bacterium]MDO8092694.1 multiheme c-type cytochrome [Candidatus Brocadiales bacterium]
MAGNKKNRYLFVFVLGIVFLLVVLSYLKPGDEKPAPTTAPGKRVAAAGPSFQEVASKIFGQAVGPDDSGEKYVFGLTATYTGPENILPGEGKYKDLFYFLPVIRWYDPAHYYTSTQEVEGTFKQEECIICHTAQTPTIVKDWKVSRHATPPEGKEGATCVKCHGSNHMQLTLPTHETCKECHPTQVAGHTGSGLGGHSYAFHINTVEFDWHVGKPPEEVSACAECHGIIENRCDGCHTRHKFSAAESRRPSACMMCHQGVDHAEWEAWMGSTHGAIYEAEGNTWDWNKPAKGDNYRVPSCSYCHMRDGEHNTQAFSTTYSDMGMFLVDRGALKWNSKRDSWVNVCKNCHSPRFARDFLEAMDEAINVSFAKWREAVNVVVGCYLEGVIDPMPADLAPDWYGHYTFSLLPGGEPRMYNISNIERLAFEMICYQIARIYKARAHGSLMHATYTHGAFPADRQLTQIKAEASKLKRMARLEKHYGIQHKAFDFWKHGEYTDLLTGWKRKDGDLHPEECLHGSHPCRGESH